MAISLDGRCLCGCGQLTELWTRTCRANGQVAGAHRAFVRGHARPIAPDGLGVTYADTKWCPRCSQRLPIGRFRPNGQTVQAYCASCELAAQRERYRTDPEYRRQRLERMRLASKTPEGRERMRRNRARFLERKRALLEERRREDKLERVDPMCLRLGSEAGVELIDEVVAHHGSATAAEESLGMSIGHLNRFRREKYVTFDLVDRLLTMMGEPWRLDDYEFRRRSEWIALDGPTAATTARRGRAKRKRAELAKTAPPPAR